jgi:hypothetical protein
MWATSPAAAAPAPHHCQAAAGAAAAARAVSRHQDGNRGRSAPQQPGRSHPHSVDAGATHRPAVQRLFDR